MLLAFNFSFLSLTPSSGLLGIYMVTPVTLLPPESAVCLGGGHILLVTASLALSRHLDTSVDKHGYSALTRARPASDHPGLLITVQHFFFHPSGLCWGEEADYTAAHHKTFCADSWGGIFSLRVKVSEIHFSIGAKAPV